MKRRLRTAYLVLLFCISCLVSWSCTAKGGGKEGSPPIQGGTSGIRDYVPGQDLNKIEAEENYPYENVKMNGGRLFAYQTEPRITDMEEFLSLFTDEELAAIDWLDMSFNQITKISGLDRLPNLVRLGLSSNKIRRVDFAELPETIKFLDLNSNPIAGKFHGSSAMKNIYSLDMAYTKVSHVDGLENLSGIAGISFTGCPIENPKEFLKFQALENEISFSAVKISEEELDNLEQQLHIQNPLMKVLIVEPYIPPPAKNRRYQKVEIDLSRGRGTLTVTRSDAPLTNMREYLSMYTGRELVRIESLTMSHNQITEITGLELLPNLSELDLTGNRIRHVDMSRLPLPMSLTLKSNPIEREFFLGPNAQDMYFLSMEDTKVTHVYGLENLINNIQGLNFLGCPIENPEEFVKVKYPSSINSLRFSVANASAEKILELRNEMLKQNPTMTDGMEGVLYIESYEEYKK